MALSRARLGLYILGRPEVFQSCFELKQAFDILFQRPTKLQLVTGEMFPSQRILAEEEGRLVPGETQMEGVEHLGQYVYEMTNSKVQQLRAERGLPEAELVEARMEDIQEEGYVEAEGYPTPEGDDAEEIKDGSEAEEINK